ncbi:MAG TPA: hypothetical protein VIL74_10575 [Pyrinomonadaceae bacterium]|jgi:hypothetical protein
MNLRDIFIIYLACGAPFAVAYFLQNRNRAAAKFLWLKTLFRFVFWVPFAVQKVVRTGLLTNLYHHAFALAPETDANEAREIDEIRRFFERKLPSRAFSIYELRETFERYVGLSLEVRSDASEIAPSENEIYRITNHANKKLAAVCLNRRNRKRLSFHQNLARRDFFEILGKFVDRSESARDIFERAARLAVLVGDAEAERAIAELAAESTQIADRISVKNTGKEIWMPDQHKPLSDSTISTNLQVLTATANLSNKD